MRALQRWGLSLAPIVVGVLAGCAVPEEEPLPLVHQPRHTKEWLKRYHEKSQETPPPAPLPPRDTGVGLRMGSLNRTGATWTPGRQAIPYVSPFARRPWDRGYSPRAAPTVYTAPASEAGGPRAQDPAAPIGQDGPGARSDRY